MDKVFAKNLLILLGLGVLMAGLCGFLAWWFIFDGWLC